VPGVHVGPEEGGSGPRGSTTEGEVVIGRSEAFDRIIMGNCAAVKHTEHGDVYCTQARRHDGDHKADDGEGNVVLRWPR
jgi:hypothetical protein